MVRFFIFTIILGSQSAFAYFYELGCSASYQEKVGQNTKTIPMKVSQVSSEGFGDVIFQAELLNRQYEVIWHKNLDTFYMTIKNGTQKVFFTTARVPNFEHNDTMADVTMPDGTRRWISCAYEPKGE